MLPCFARQVGDECICSVEVLRRLVEQRFCHRRLAAIELSCLGGVSGLQNGASHQCDRIRPELVPGAQVERLVTVVVDLDGRGQVSQLLQMLSPFVDVRTHSLGPRRLVCTDRTSVACRLLQEMPPTAGHDVRHMDQK